jgi:hypothetical protein
MYKQMEGWTDGNVRILWKQIYTRRASLLLVLITFSYIRLKDYGWRTKSEGRWWSIKVEGWWMDKVHHMGSVGVLVV